MHPIPKKACLALSSSTMSYPLPTVLTIMARPAACSANGVSRRKFLRSALYILGLLAADPAQALAAAARTRPRRLALYHVRTGESLDICYRTPTGYDQAALTDVSRLMRDRVTGEVKPIDPHLLDYLFSVQSILEARAPFHIFSGYRSPKTNSRLRRAGKGAALNSYHLKGQAVDLGMPGVDTTALHQAALEARAGGVGYYPARHFVHLDVGPVRHWSA